MSPLIYTESRKLFVLTDIFQVMSLKTVDEFILHVIMFFLSDVMLLHVLSLFLEKVKNNAKCKKPHVKFFNARDFTYIDILSNKKHNN